MAQIFISHAHEDKALAKKLADFLEEEGWTVWWDPKIGVGVSWRDTIAKELRDSECVIVLWSSNSVASHWVLDEAEEGAKRSILVPIALGDVNIPLGFGAIQAARLPVRNWKLGDPNIDAVRQAIAKILGPAASRAPAIHLSAKGPPFPAAAPVFKRDFDLGTAKPPRPMRPERDVLPDVGEAAPTSKGGLGCLLFAVGLIGGLVGVVMLFANQSGADIDPTVPPVVAVLGACFVAIGIFLLGRKR